MLNVITIGLSHFPNLLYNYFSHIQTQYSLQHRKERFIHLLLHRKLCIWVFLIQEVNTTIVLLLTTYTDPYSVK